MKAKQPSIKQLIKTLKGLNKDTANLLQQVKDERKTKRRTKK